MGEPINLDFEVFLEKIESNYEKIRPCASKIGYYTMFRDIYNLRNRFPVS